jgi:hypothetical protein
MNANQTPADLLTITETFRGILLNDVQYALRQLRQFGDIARATDALERVEYRLQHAEDYLPESAAPEAAEEDESMKALATILARQCAANLNR